MKTDKKHKTTVKTLGSAKNPSHRPTAKECTLCVCIPPRLYVHRDADGSLTSYPACGTKKPLVSGAVRCSARMAEKVGMQALAGTLFGACATLMGTQVNVGVLYIVVATDTGPGGLGAMRLFSRDEGNCCLKGDGWCLFFSG